MRKEGKASGKTSNKKRKIATVVAGFRVEARELTEAKRRLVKDKRGVGYSVIMRVLMRKWLAGKVRVSIKDIEKWGGW
jgi:hypothetical protein